MKVGENANFAVIYSLQGMASHNTEALIISEADFTTNAMVNTNAIVAWHADRVDPVVGVRPARSGSHSQTRARPYRSDGASR
jgi:hypothetical protein